MRIRRTLPLLVLLLWCPSAAAAEPADGMTSWDRGWNDAGEQVWGAEDAGYVFLRR